MNATPLSVPRRAAALLLATALVAPAADGVTRRFTLAVGSHEGGPGRERLLFADADARAFRGTLEELGGLDPGDATLLVDPDSATLLGAMDALATRVLAAKRGGARTEALVYYSGHADEAGLQLGRQTVDYREFRARMNALGADVRIGVVDACASGALTRFKGGRSVPAFMVDKSSRAEGYAFLTSSSASEVAQESDQLRGSYFTHALNTGLRGAADASRDGKVTLHEAYQFAYNETLARTESTRGGPQHAGYEMQLSGSGDVVLTDLREASSSLVLAEELQGRLFIRDSLENLVAELQKPAGHEVILGLSPGVYGLRLLQGIRWNAASVTLREGKSAVVSPSAFKPVATDTLSPAVAADPDTGNFHHVADTRSSDFSSAIFYDVQKDEWRGTQLALAATDARSHLRGGQLTLGVNVTRGDLEGYQAAVGLNAVGGSLHGFQIAQANIASGHLEGAQFGSIFSVAGEHALGLQLSGIFNVAGGGLKGWQGAGIFNVSGRETHGGQISGIFALTADSLRGGAGAGIFTAVGGNVWGGQGAGIFNATGGSLQGGQGAGIFNAVRGDVKGGQGAGIFNAVAGDVKGGQGAGIFNATWGDVKGGQGAGIFNASAGHMQGVQGAGIFNAAGRLSGFQLAGILNLAGTANGYQIGLVNVSNEYESGVPIGLVNVSRKGGFEGQTWIEETGTVFAGLRTSVRWVHSDFAVGTKTLGNRRLVMPTLGAGMHFDLGESPLQLETGLLYSMIFAADGKALNDAGLETDWNRVRLGLGWRPLRYFTLFGGLSYNISAHYDANSPATGSDYPFFTTVSNTVSLWPGAYAGIRIGK